MSRPYDEDDMVVDCKTCDKYSAEIAALESTNSKLRDELSDAYNHLHGTHHCNCDFIASKGERGEE